MTPTDERNDKETLKDQKDPQSGPAQEEAGQAAAETEPDKETVVPEDAIAVLEDRLAAMEKEKEDFKDRFYRISAEFDNYKKRVDRQWTDFKKYSHEALVKELLTVIDNLERAVEAAAQGNGGDSGLLEGIQITLTEIFKILERFGVTPFDSKGEKFDPGFHQAVSTQPAEDVGANIVLEELQKGYLIHDRLLRPAMVVVSAAPSA
ncbi:MAG: nucleotide exchange factor GrpE [Desulfosudaceae bacterium]